MTKNYYHLKVIFMLLLIPFCNLLHGQAVANFEWAKGVGSIASDASNSIVTDKYGNSYITGNFNDVTDFNPGPGVSSINTNGLADIFIMKLDVSGNFVWAKSMGSTVGDQGHSIALDTSGNVFVAGRFTGTVDFDPGVSVFNLVGLSPFAQKANTFVLKLTSDGNFLWAKRFGATGLNSTTLTTDRSGNVLVAGVYITGDYRDFGNDTIPAYGGNDVFITKLDGSGNFLWSKGVGGTSGDVTGAKGGMIKCDTSGNVYLIGQYAGTADMDPGAGVANITTTTGSSASGTDIFVLKLSSAGNFVWAKSIGGVQNDQASGIATDNQNDIYLLGDFMGAADFDPGPGTFTLTPAVTGAAGRDFFVSKWTGTGNFVWAKQFGGVGSDLSCAIAVDPFRNVYAGGEYMSDSVDFNPGTGTYMLSGMGGFIVKLDSVSNFVWATQFNTSSRVQCITLDTANNVLSTGGFTNNTNFNYATGPFLLSSVGSNDIFVHKMNQNCSSSASFSYTDCDSFTLNNQTYNTSGVYTQVLDNVNVLGCDSILTLTLTINHSVADTLIQSLCAANFTLNGQTYDTSGIFVQTYTTATGCDSLIVLDLTLSHELYGDTITATACHHYTFNNVTYTESGTYSPAFPLSVGCDSITILNLTINTVDTSVTQNGINLTANASGAYYQWLDCANGYLPIQGASSQTFSSNIDGVYAVQVRVGDCTDTSSCFAVLHTGIDDPYKEHQIWLYPNPASATVMVVASAPLKDAAFRLIDVLGRAAKKYRHQSGSHFTLDINECVPGIYYLEIEENGTKNRIRLVKQ